MGMAAENKVLDALGVDHQPTGAGCCGLAGSFGFEAGEKYEVSVQAGERVLAPLVRSLPESTVLIADGFSCKTQIEQLTGRRALHLAQVVKMALDDGPEGLSGGPEDRYPDRVGRGRPSAVEIMLGAAVATAAAALAWKRRSTR